MNNSGAAGAAVAAFYRIAPGEILVVHDEIDLPPGVARLKRRGPRRAQRRARRHGAARGRISGGCASAWGTRASQDRSSTPCSAAPRRRSSSSSSGAGARARGGAGCCCAKAPSKAMQRLHSHQSPLHGRRRHEFKRENDIVSIKCGIVGLPNVGKSTLFNALTRAQIAAENYPFCTIDPNVGIVPVPDPRLEAAGRHRASGEDPADHGRVRRHRRPGRGGLPGRGPGQQVPGAHPRDRRDRARRALLRARRHRARRRQASIRSPTSMSSTPSWRSPTWRSVEKALDRAAKAVKSGDKDAVRSARRCSCGCAAQLDEGGPARARAADRRGAARAARAAAAHRQARDVCRQRR